MRQALTVVMVVGLATLPAACGKSPEEKAADAKPKTRASIVSEMEAAIAESYPLVEKSPSPRLVGWLDHQGEHYGKLVTAYRVNGVVPPVSRPK